MPPTETPPNPAPAAPPPPPEPVKVVTRRFGEVDHTELVQLLDSLEGDQAKSRFRESIYISIIIYLLLGWLAVYGPKYVFRQGTVVPSAAQQQKEKLSQLELDRDLAKLEQKPPKIAPKLNQQVIKRLQQDQQERNIAKAETPPPPAPTPAPAPAPAPTPAPAPPAPAPPLPSAPTPQPQLPKAPTPQPSSIPDAPRPNFSTPSTAGSSVADAANRAARNRGGGNMSDGPSSHVGQQGAGTGVEILSDTQGVDFTDYIKKVLRMLKAAWLPLIPEECYPPLNKEGWTLIRFRILPNGQLAQPMTLDASTDDRAIDKAAWGSIVSVAQFPPLPAAYKGPNLDLRIQFIISKDAPDTQ